MPHQALDVDVARPEYPEEDLRRITLPSASAKDWLTLGRVSTPGGDRTPDLLVRSQALCPAELRAHLKEAKIAITR
jgi:hypothetical protein